jgi:hypothetical protein
MGGTRGGPEDQYYASEAKNSTQAHWQSYPHVTASGHATVTVTGQWRRVYSISIRVGQVVDSLDHITGVLYTCEGSVLEKKSVCWCWCWCDNGVHRSSSFAPRERSSVAHAQSRPPRKANMTTHTLYWGATSNFRQFASASSPVTLCPAFNSNTNTKTQLR